MFLTVAFGLDSRPLDPLADDRLPRVFGTRLGEALVRGRIAGVVGVPTELQGYVRIAAKNRGNISHLCLGPWSQVRRSWLEFETIERVPPLFTGALSRVVDEGNQSGLD